MYKTREYNIKTKCPVCNNVIFMGKWSLLIRV